MLDAAITQLYADLEHHQLHRKSIFTIPNPQDYNSVIHGRGTLILWQQNTHWLINTSYQTKVSNNNAYIFDSPTDACQWLYQESYYAQHINAIRQHIRHLQHTGQSNLAQTEKTLLTQLEWEHSHRLSHPRTPPTNPPLSFYIPDLIKDANQAQPITTRPPIPLRRPRNIAPPNFATHKEPDTTKR